MDWTTKPLARVSSLSGQPFNEGDRVVSLLRRDGELFERLDYLESELTAETMPGGEILGRWNRVVKPAPASQKQAREQELAGAEEMFLALVADEQAEEDPDRLALLQMLALTLERRRVLKALGQAQDGVQPYLHLPTKTEMSVQVVDLTPEQLLRIGPQLPCFAD